jgi:hypothetical protein
MAKVDLAVVRKNIVGQIFSRDPNKKGGTILINRINLSKSQLYCAFARIDEKRIALHSNSQKQNQK